MPSLQSVVKRFTRQTVTYFAKIGSDPNGKPVYDVPVEIKCRLEDKVAEILMPTGRKVITKGYLLLSQPLVVGSVVYNGTLAEWKALPTYPAVPTVNQGGIEILKLNTTPDIKGIPVVYEAYF